MKQPSCFKCKQNHLCFVRREFENAFRAGSGMLNINSDARPGKYLDIFATLASACFLYSPEEEKETEEGE